MPIAKPQVTMFSALYRNCRTLHFANWNDTEQRRDGWTTQESRVWGGIAWPTMRGPVGAERVEGFACIVAENIEDRVVTVYEQELFITVEPELIPGKGVERGFANYYQDWFARYGCSMYSCVGRRDTERETWEPQIRHCRMIHPQPLLREEAFDANAAFAEILTRAQAGQIRHSAGEPVDVAIQDARNDRTDVAPAMMAVAAALKGIRSLGITIMSVSEKDRKTPGEWARIFQPMQQ